VADKISHRISYADTNSQAYAQTYAEAHAQTNAPTFSVADTEAYIPTYISANSPADSISNSQTTTPAHPQTGFYNAAKCNTPGWFWSYQLFLRRGELHAELELTVGIRL